MTLSDQELVRRAKKDADAFGELYDKYYDRIFHYVLKRTGKVAISQDIVSITFIKALENIGKYQITETPFSAWIYRIAINEIANFYRNKNNKNSSLDTLLEYGFDIKDNHDLEYEIEIAQEKVERKKAFLKIQKMLMTLDIKYQNVISLRYFEKKKLSEISEILNLKEGTVKSLLSRALDKIRNKLNATN